MSMTIPIKSYISYLFIGYNIGSFQISTEKRKIQKSTCPRGRCWKGNRQFCWAGKLLFFFFWKKNTSIYFSYFSCRFLNSKKSNLNSNCSIILDLRKLYEQVKNTLGRQIFHDFCPLPPDRGIFFTTKGQLISKYLFGIFNSPKKRTKNSTLLLWYLKSNSFCSFFGRIEDTKKTFWN